MDHQVTDLDCKSKECAPAIPSAKPQPTACGGSLTTPEGSRNDVEDSSSSTTQKSTSPSQVTDEDCAEALLCARYGETDDLEHLLSSKVNVDHQDPYTLSTCLHYASANGHLDCIKVLINHKASYMTNASGNFPLHWALEQSNSLETVKLLLDTFKEIDILALNSFGKSALTSSFKTNNKEFINLILAHDSAAPLDKSKPKDSVMPSRDVAVTHQMTFKVESSDAAIKNDCASGTDGGNDDIPLIHVRERAIYQVDVFGKEMEASKDTTGLALWPASIIMAYWITDQDTQQLFDDKRVLELGAGCGLPGLVAAAYTNASHVVLSDYFPETMDNLRHNVQLNKSTGVLNRHGALTVSTLAVDWAEVKSWAASKHTQEPFDIVIGTDLVYHNDIVGIFVETLAYALRAGGNFLYVSRERRGGMALLDPALQAAGFELIKRREAPREYRRNPMLSATEDYCKMYFKNLLPSSGQSFELFHYKFDGFDNKNGGMKSAEASSNDIAR